MMTELDVLRLLLARRKNYDITDIQFVGGRVYSITMGGRAHTAIIVPNAFDFYAMRYHLCEQMPTLVVCFTHDAVVPVACLTLNTGHIGRPHDLPAQIKNVEAQRHRSKAGSQVLLTMYLCGMREAMKIVDSLKPRSRCRYLARARELGKRKRGRPVGGLERTHP
jgi:hypothetical protein